MLQMMYIAEMSKDRQREALKAAETSRLVQMAKVGLPPHPTHIGRPATVARLIRRATSLLSGVPACPLECPEPSH